MSTKNEEIRKIMAIGLMFNCPYGEKENCPVAAYKIEFQKNPAKAIKSISMELIDQILEIHIECSHCLDKELFKKFLSIQ